MGGSEGRAGPNRRCPRVPPAMRMPPGTTRGTGSAEGCEAGSASALALWWAVGVSRDNVTGAKGFLANLKTLQVGGALNAAKRCLGKVRSALRFSELAQGQADGREPVISVVAGSEPGGRGSKR